MINTLKFILGLYCLGIVACAKELPPAASAVGRGSAPQASACREVSRHDRRSNLFERAQITRVAPVYERVTRIKSVWNELRGSRIDLRATPGMTRQWLTVLARCQAAYAADHATLTHHNPLAVGPVDVAVEDRANGFSVLIRTKHADKTLAKRVLQTSRELFARAALD